MSDEDFKGAKLYDAALVKRLLHYAKSYRLLLGSAFLFLLLTAVVELYLPVIQGKSIDRFIAVDMQLADFSQNHSAREEILARYGKNFFPVSEDSFLFDGAALDPADMISLMEQNILAQNKFFPLDLQNYPTQALQDSAEKLVLKNSPPFFKVGARVNENDAAVRKVRIPFTDAFQKPVPHYAIAYENLAKIPKSELQVIRSKDINGLSNLAFLYLVLLLLSFAINFCQLYALNLSAQKIMHDMRVELFKHIQKLSMKYFNTTPAGVIVSRATNDINSIAEMFTSVLVVSLKDIFTFAGVTVIIFALNIKLSFLLVALVPFIVTSTIFFRKGLREAYRWFRKALALVNAKLSEDISGVKIIQAYVQEWRAQQLFEKANVDLYDASMRMLWVNSVFRPFVSIFENIALALIIWYGGGQVIRQTLSLGMLVIYVSYIRMFFQPILAIADKFSILQGAMAAAERIFGLLDTNPDISECDAPFVPSDTFLPKIEFKNVWFAYNDENWVLRDVSFDVEVGKKLAIVGATGAGKTTIASLITRLYDIQRGEILVDGVNIKQWKISDLRKRVGVVLQDVFLFSSNIRDNIDLGDEDISFETVVRSAEIVNAKGFIDALPCKFDAQVAERGATLSAGQRQLLSFARALAFNPSILILDEATANIDTHTEVLIQDAIDKLMSQRTSIIIAHRLSTIRKADNILVMHKGKIVERGTHSELIACGGYYAKLYELQFKSQSLSQ